MAATFAEFRTRHFSWADRLVFRDDKEILDLEVDSPRAVRVVRDLDRFSRASGLYRTLLAGFGARLAAVARTERRPVRVLDVCCGYGGFCRVLAEWARRKAIPIEIVGVDNAPAFVAGARRACAAPEVTFVTADACALPFADGAFDLATNVQSLHHFDAPLVTRLLRETLRTSRALFFFDLRRTAYGFALIHLLRPFFSGEFVHDGRLSHRRAYSVPELRFLVREAGVRARVRPFLPLGLVLDSAG